MRSGIGRPTKHRRPFRRWGSRRHQQTRRPARQSGDPRHDLPGPAPRRGGGAAQEARHKMTELNDLRRPDGAHRPSKRLGRGPGSGHGQDGRQRATRARRPAPGIKASGLVRGRPDAAAAPRSQAGLHQPLPGRVSEIVNLRDLERVDEDEITPEVLHGHRLVDPNRGPGEAARRGGDRAQVTVRRARRQCQRPSEDRGRGRHGGAHRGAGAGRRRGAESESDAAETGASPRELSPWPIRSRTCSGSRS